MYCYGVFNRKLMIMIKIVLYRIKYNFKKHKKVKLIVFLSKMHFIERFFATTCRLLFLFSDTPVSSDTQDTPPSVITNSTEYAEPHMVVIGYGVVDFGCWESRSN